MNVAKANGDPLDMSTIDNIQYDVRIAGTSESVTEGYKATNVAAQLLPGNYDAHVMITHRNAVRVDLVKLNIYIADEHVSLAESNRYMLREGYTLNCVPTGAVRINVTGKPNSTYGIRLLESPAAYTGLTDFTNLPMNAYGAGSYTLEKLPSGRYVYHVYNECEGVSIKEFAIKNYTKADGTIASDLPVLNSNVPYGLVINSTCSGISSIELYGPNRKTGVFSIITNRFESSTPYRHHYNYDQGGPLNFYGFFEYATVTREEVTKLENNQITVNDFNWRQGGEQGNPNSWDRTYLRHSFSSPYPTYADLRDPNYQKTPVRLYVRVKGSADCFSYIPLAIPQKNYQHQLSLSQATWDCQNYKTTVTSTSNTSTVCKRVFSLYEIDANGTQVGDTLLTKTDISGGKTVVFAAGQHPLDPNKKYMVKVVVSDYEGVVHNDSIELIPPATEYLMRSIVEAYVNMPNCPWDENARTANMMLGYTSQEKLDNMIITLLEAPAGYDATQTLRPGYKMLGVNEPYTIPDGNWVNRFYPFAFNETTGKSDYNDFVVLPEGDYKFRYESLCAPGKMVEFTVPVQYAPYPKKNSDIQIATEVECDYIKVYPFRNQIIDYNVDKDGNPNTLIFKFSGHLSTSTGSSEFSFNPQNINQPSVQNFFLRVAKRADVVITVDYIVSYTSQAQYWGRNYGVYPNVPITRGNNSSTGTCAFHTQQIAVPYEPLTYERTTYYGYKCQDGFSAQMGIKGINGKGPYTYILQSVEGVVLKTQAAVPAGQMAYFNFSDSNIATRYKMIVKDDGCSGEEVYEDLLLADLSTSVINPYARKICSGGSVSVDISPINGVNGIVEDGTMKYTWTIKTDNPNIVGLQANPTDPIDTVKSGMLSLASGVTTLQTAVYEVTPYSYGVCPGQPFDITIVVSPCINYWQGGTDTDWNKTSNWTENTVPLAGEDIIFATEENNPYFKNVPNSGAAVRDLHVPTTEESITIGNLTNESDKAIVVPAGAGLVVTGEVTGSETDPSKIVLKADATNPSGSLFISNANACDMAVHATVEMYSKAKATSGTFIDNDPNSPDKGKEETLTHTWQYFGIPVANISLSKIGTDLIKSTGTPTFWLRERKEERNDPNHFYRKWQYMNTSQALDAFWGYELTQNEPSIYIFKGKLNTCPSSITLTRKAEKVTAVKTTTDEKIVRHELGRNVVANSYTAAMTVKSLTFDDVLDKTIYLYNTGIFANCI